MNIQGPGTIQNPIISKRTAVNVISLRNNSLIQYYNNSELNENRLGTKSTLKQNLKTSYSERLINLQQIKDFDDFYTYNDNVKNIERLYELHKKEILNTSLSKIPFCRQFKCKDVLLGYRLKDLGTISENQVKKIKKCIENMISLSLFNSDYTTSIKDKSYCTFVTLTLPSKQVHSDKLIRKCLTTFLDNLKKTHNVNHFVWKAETQKNGNIHFHVVIDRYIHWQNVRLLWNKQISKLGYIQFYKNNRLKAGFVYRPYIEKNGNRYINKKSKKEQYDNYLKDKNEGFANPNTTDIHSLKGVTNSISYILKYLTKLEPNKRPVIGAVWGAANITKKLDYPKFYETEKTFKQLNHLIKSERLKCVLKDDFFSVFVGKIFDIVQKEYCNVWESVKKHYQTLKNITNKIDFKGIERIKIIDICNNINDYKKENKPIYSTIKQKLSFFQYNIYGDLSPC